MQASELRIGNLLVRKKSVFTNVPIEKVVFRVNMLSPINYPKKDFVVYDNIPETGVEDTYRLSECRPIPLMSGWLKRLGFSLEITNGGFLKWQKGEFKLLDRRLPHPQFHAPGARIDYVHQLQNLYFALTGEELKLK